MSNNMESLSKYLRALTKGICSKSISDKFMNSPYWERFVGYVEEDCKKQEADLRKKISNCLLSSLGWDKDKSEKGAYFRKLLYFGKKQYVEKGLNDIVNDISLLEKKLSNETAYLAPAISKSIEFFYPKDKEPSAFVDFVILSEMQKRMPKFAQAEIDEIYTVLSSNMEDRIKTFLDRPLNGLGGNKTVLSSNMEDRIKTLLDQPLNRLGGNKKEIVLNKRKESECVNNR